MRLAVVLIGLLWAAPVLGQPLRVAVVNLEQGDLRERLEEAVLFSLDFAGLDYQPLTFRPAKPEEAIEPLLSAAPELVVTIGSAGPRLASRLPPALPVIATAVGHPASFEERQGGLVGTSHYVPPSKQLVFFRKVLPGLRRLGVLAHVADENALRLLQETQQAARPLGIEIAASRIAGAQDLTAAARKLLPEVDGLLLLGGHEIASEAWHVLEAAADWRRPVFAFDEEMVSRGAVAALYADRLALAEDVGPMAKQLLIPRGTHSAFRTPHSPFAYVRTLPIFKIVLNVKAARALGLRLPYNLLVIANKIIR